jgi:IS5 family transposase
MRRKAEAFLGFENYTDRGMPKIVRQHYDQYRRLGQVLDRHPEVLEAAAADLAALSAPGNKGREGDFTAENLLRALIVMSRQGLTFRETILQIAGNGFLQDFVRLRKKPVMDFSTLDKAFLAIRPETWKSLNDALGIDAAKEKKIDPDVIRVDTTVIESNVHYPTDSSLLWDVWRTAERLLEQAREIAPELVAPHRFHGKKVKKMFIFTTRYAASKDKKRRKEVQRQMRTLLRRTHWIVEIAAEFCEKAQKSLDFVLASIERELADYLPAMRTILDTARRAQLEGERVPAADRVFSLFEPHTELIKRGRRGKPVEFGHKFLLCQTAEKFITDYEVLETQTADCNLTETAVERHKELFGKPPKVMSADKGFRPDAATFEDLEEEVETLAIPHRLRDFADKMMVMWQAFRAGIEGTISRLKRAFRLSRCFFKGFKGFARGVGLQVFTHNLTILADLDGG